MQTSDENFVRSYTAVKRQDLDRIAQRTLDFPTTLIEAPAGYGKTHLLLQLLQRLSAMGEAAINLGSCRALADEPALLRNLIAGLAALVDFADGDMPANTQHTLLGLLTKVADSRNRILFILDDIDKLDPASAALLQQLIEATPANVRWIFSARGKGHFDWGRHALYGTLNRLGRQQLACTRDELQALAMRMGIPALDDVFIEGLITEWEGWWPGISLALAELVSGATNSESRQRILNSYFEEEVLQHWLPEQRSAIAKLAVLQDIFPDIAQTLAPEFDIQNLQLFESQGQFVFQTQKSNGNAWRLHAALRLFLTHRLASNRPSELIALHERACEWFDAHDRGIEAVHHAAQTGNTKRLAETLEKYCETLHYAGLGWRMDEYASTLPEEMLSRLPLTLLMLTWLRIRSQHFREARALIAKTENRIAQLAKDGGAPATIERLSLLLKHRRVILAYAEDKLETAETSARELIPAFENDRLASTLYAPIIASRSERMEFDDFDELRITAHKLIDRSDYRVAHVSLDAVIGAVMIELGRSEKAEEVLTSALRIASQIAGNSSSMAALPAMPLSRLHYEMNDLPFARQLIDRHLPRIGDMGLTDQLIEGYLTKARLLALDNTDTAHSVLDKGLAHVQAGSNRLAVALLGERIKLFIGDGHIELAEELRPRCGVEQEPDSVKPKTGVSMLTQDRATIWTRLALAAGNSAEALNVATQWRRVSQQRHAVLSTLHWSILIVRCHLALDNLREAQRELRQAVALAAPNKFTRCFLDEGEPLRSLLAMTFTSTESTNPHDAFAMKICIDAGLNHVAQPVSVNEAARPSSVTAREIEILHLAAGGLHNWEIGNQLGLTEGTVKWHLQNIYDKLGARRRSQAVDMARSFGILPR